MKYNESSLGTGLDSSWPGNLVHFGNGDTGNRPQVLNTIRRLDNNAPVAVDGGLSRGAVVSLE